MTSACVGQIALQQFRNERLSAEPSTLTNTVDVTNLRALRNGIDVIEVHEDGKRTPRILTLNLTEFDGTILIATQKKKKGFFGSGSKGPEEVYLRVDIGSIIAAYKGHQSVGHSAPIASAPKKKSKSALTAIDERRDPAEDTINNEYADKDYIFIAHYLTSEEKLSVTIFYSDPGSGRSTLDLIFKNRQDLMDFHESLIACMNWNNTVPKLLLQDMDYSLMRSLFVEHGKMLDDNRKGIDKFNTMSKAEFFYVLESKLGVVTLDKKALAKSWSKYCTFLGIDKEADLTASQCSELLQLIREQTSKTISSPYKSVLKMVQDQPPNIDSATFAELEKDNLGDYITAAQFLSFLRHEQKEEKVSLKDIRSLFEKINQQQSNKFSSTSSQASKEVINTLISKEAFLNYLQSDDNDAFDPAKGWFSRTNMSMPLSNYWINTSYDAWEDNFDGVLFSLTRGCRCIELTLWDNKTGEPVVCRRAEEISMKDRCHLFVDIIKQVKIFLLANGDVFPIILLLESHCTVNAQNKVARYLQDVLGSSLFVPHDLSGPLPSPQALKGRVVIKFKHTVSPQADMAIFDDYDEDLGAEKNDRSSIFASPSFQSVITRQDTTESFISESPHLFEESTPQELWEIAVAEAKQAKEEARKAEEKAFHYSVQANAAEEMAAKLFSKNHLAEAVSPSTWNIETSLGAALAALIKVGSAVSGTEIEVGESKEFGDESTILTQDADTEASVVDEDPALKKLKKQVDDTEEVAKAANEALSIALAELQEASAKVMVAQKELEAAKQKEQSIIDASDSAVSNARKSRDDSSIATKMVQTLRKQLQNAQDEVRTTEASAKTAASEAKISQDRASDAEARAKAARDKSTEAQLSAESETRIEEMMDKETEFARTILRDAEKRVMESEKRKNEAKLKLQQEKKQLLVEKAKEASELHLTALSAKLDAQTTLKEAEKKSRKQAQKAAAARLQADQFSTITEQLEEHAEEEKQAAKLRRIAWEKAEANFRRTEAELASAKAQLAAAIKHAQSSKDSVSKNRENAKKLVNEANEAKKLRKVKLEGLKVAIENKNLAQEAFDAAQEIRDRKKDDLAAVRKTYTEAMEIHYATQREVSEQKYKEHKQQSSLRAAVKARERASHLREKANAAKAAAEEASRLAAEKAAEERYAFQYKEKKQKVLPVSKVLCDITLLHGSKFKVWENSLTEPYCNMHSMAQKKVVDLFKRHPESWINFLDYNTNHLSRVFESEDKNLNPLFPWAMGCQLASVKSSGTPNVESWLNDGRFRENGSSGYVLKPTLRSKGGIRGALCHLKIRVLSGNRLPPPTTHERYRSSNLRVTVSLYDVPPRYTSVSTSSYITKTVTGNRLNPVWNEAQDKCAAFEVYNPDVAMVLFTVWDAHESMGNKYLVGVSSIPFSCLREGYRSVQLFDENFTRCGAYSFASLFIHISLS